MWIDASLIGRVAAMPPARGRTSAPATGVTAAGPS
jgi:hypothetical protein